MALVVADRVQETTSTTGTSDYTLSGAVLGYQSFGSVLANADTTYYAITNNTDWEVGVGTYSITGPTLARTTILASSSGGSAVNWGAGVKNIFISYAASKSVYLDANGDLLVSDKIVHAGDTNTAIRFPAADTVAIDTGGTERFKVENSTITTTVPVILPADPTLALQAATKQYVDTLVASGIHFHQPVRVESPINLNATYNNGTAGVGATLTNAGTQVALVIDGVTVATNDRVLVYEQTDQTQNGVYVVTSTGSGSTNWVLTRSADTDTYVINDANGLSEGSTVFVQEGTTGAGETYTCNTSGVITFGTTNITFVQISSAQIYSAGAGLALTGTVFSNTAPDQVVTLTQGGATTITGTYPNFTITSTDTTYSAGGGIGLTGTTFSVAAGSGLTQDTDGLSHADTSSQSSVDNTGANVIQDVSLDGFGHVTSLASVTITPALIGAQPSDTELTSIAALAVTDGNFIVGNGTTWVAESGATARTSLGLTIGTNVQAWDANLDQIAALAPTADNFIVGNGTAWVLETPAQALASLGVTSTAAELNILDGVTATAAELNLVDGSAAGTIVNSKAVVYGAAGQVNATTLQIAGTSITATAAELNTLDGITATVTELNYTDGVTSAIQTQLNAKAPLASPALTGTPTAPTASAGTNTTQVATTAFVGTALTTLNATNLTSGTVPDARMTGTYSGFTHKMDGSNTVFTTPNTGSSSTLARTVYGLAEYRSNSSAQVGALVFIAPNTTSTIMHQLEISGMLYNQNIVSMTVQGYRTTGAWSDVRKISTGTVDVQTRWAVDPSGKNCLILGDVGTSWSYPHFSIVRAMFSHTNAGDAYCSGWTVAVVTSLTGYTQLTATIVDSTMVGSISGNAATVTTLTTAQVGTATAGLAAGAVGSYAFLSPASTATVYNPGATLAGSSLRYTGTESGGALSVFGTAPGGTWRIMGYKDATTLVASVWLRIS